MSVFRYEQFCPLARAAEVLGERWTLLVIRELLLGPQRFSDLLRRLAGVSTSVLSARLRGLEERGLVERRELPPPASSTVYELTSQGRELRPVVIELARFGTRLLGVPRAGDHFEPDWLRLAGMVFARPDATSSRAFRVCVSGSEPESTFFVRGGPDGTAVSEDSCAVDASLRADPLSLLALLSGSVAPDSLVASGALQVDGDATALRDFPTLFDVPAATPNDEENLS